jgi:hypothetical protein
VESKARGKNEYSEVEVLLLSFLVFPIFDGESIQVEQFLDQPLFFYTLKSSISFLNARKSTFSPISSYEKTLLR